VVLLAAEVVLEYLEWRQARLSAPLRMTTEFDPQGMLMRSESCSYQLRPSCQHDLWGGQVRIDRNGFRSSYDVSPQKDPHRTRIMLTGGSTAFGWGVPDGQDVAAYLGAMLNGSWEKGPYEVIDAAVPYYTSFHELNFYLHVLHDFHPDIVIVLDGRNDAHFAFMEGPDWRPVSAGVTGDIPFISLAPPASGQASFPSLDRLLMHSALYRSYDSLFPRSLAPAERVVFAGRPGRPRQVAPPTTEVNPAFIDQFVRQRTLLAREAVMDGCTCILALQPVIHVGKPLTAEEAKNCHLWGDCGPHFREYWPKLRAAAAHAEEPGAVNLDLTDVFADFHGQAYLDECHYTSDGNRLIADRLAQAVRAKTPTTRSP